jgi:hypothetical protein
MENKLEDNGGEFGTPLVENQSVSEEIREAFEKENDCSGTVFNSEILHYFSLELNDGDSNIKACDLNTIFEPYSEGYKAHQEKSKAERKELEMYRNTNIPDLLSRIKELEQLVNDLKNISPDHVSYLETLSKKEQQIELMKEEIEGRGRGLTKANKQIEDMKCKIKTVKQLAYGVEGHMWEETIDEILRQLETKE